MADQVGRDEDAKFEFIGQIETTCPGQLVGAQCIERVGVAYADNFALAYMSADFSPVVVLM